MVLPSSEVSGALTEAMEQLVLTSSANPGTSSALTPGAVR